MKPNHRWISQVPQLPEDVSVFLLLRAAHGNLSSQESATALLWVAAEGKKVMNVVIELNAKWQGLLQFSERISIASKLTISSYECTTKKYKFSLYIFFFQDFITGQTQTSHPFTKLAYDNEGNCPGKEENLSHLQDRSDGLYLI